MRVGKRWPWDHVQPLPVSVDNILLQPSATHLFLYCRGCLWATAGERRNLGPAGPSWIPDDSFQQTFADPCPKTWYSLVGRGKEHTEWKILVLYRFSQPPRRAPFSPTREHPPQRPSSRVLLRLPPAFCSPEVPHCPPCRTDLPPPAR